jgi:3-phenylpropionate/trans-cinnamate dioxygenase ferredoxin reductase subunit
MNLHADVLIVGAGQAGAQLAISLRQGGHTGSIHIAGDEPDLPYERPPLSKDYLTGERSRESLALRPDTFWGQRAISLHPGERALDVDPSAHRVRFASGGTITYSHLVWATGGRPRPLSLPGAEAAGVFALRTRADVDALRAALESCAQVAIIGAGYIGLEVAPALLKLGRRVTVLEAQERVLARVTCPEVSAFYAAEHRAHGVDLRTGVRLDSVIATAGRATGVRFADGSPDLDCDALITAIGIVPSVEVLQAAGADCGNGVEVDCFCHTSLADVFAIGDCANHVNRYAGGARVRLESVPNAVEQAKVVAAVLLGRPTPYAALPWFWSNQYDIKLQTAGLNLGHDEVLLRGRPAARSFSAVYLREGRVIALDCINAPRDFAQGKALVERGLAPPRELLADDALPLKTLADASDRFSPAALAQP